MCTVNIDTLLSFPLHDIRRHCCCLFVPHNYLSCNEGTVRQIFTTSNVRYQWIVRKTTIVSGMSSMGRSQDTKAAVLWATHTQHP